MQHRRQASAVPSLSAEQSDGLPMRQVGIVHDLWYNILAVLDWEISTIGDPLADFTYHIMQWRMPSGGTGGGTSSLSGIELKSLGIPSESEYIAMYCKRTGRPGIVNLDFYFAYNFFRLAAIMQGIAKRAIDGTAAGADAAEQGRLARPLAELGWSIAKNANG